MQYDSMETEDMILEVSDDTEATDREVALAERLSDLLDEIATLEGALDLLRDSIDDTPEDE